MYAETYELVLWLRRTKLRPYLNISTNIQNLLFFLIQRQLLTFTFKLTTTDILREDFYLVLGMSARLLIAACITLNLQKCFHMKCFWYYSLLWVNLVIVIIARPQNNKNINAKISFNVV